jgi:LacI family transcriptional regulator
MTLKARVALLIETSGGYGRDFLAGIAHYSRINGPWSFYVLPRGHEQSLPNMKLWRGTGIIARIESQAVADAISASRLPTIGLDVTPELQTGLRKLPFAEVHPDPKAIAQLAADHLLERGFRSFGFVGLKDYIFSQEREEAFAQAIKRAQNCDCPVFHLSERTRTDAYGPDQRKLGSWLRHQPKPLGLMCCNDDCGREVLDAALAAGVHVPDEIAVVGADNDELLCDLCNPPLSSVHVNAFQGGYGAAGLLHRIMNGERLAPQTTLVQPAGLVTRQSTDVVAAKDRQVALAVHFIRENACNRITVADVLRAVPMSRSILERRFKHYLGYTPHEQILRVKIERVKLLLSTTQLSLALLADRAGFEHVEYMSFAFKRAVGIPPSVYRERYNLSGRDAGKIDGKPEPARLKRPSS